VAPLLTALIVALVLIPVVRTRRHEGVPVGEWGAREWTWVGVVATAIVVLVALLVV
jgi:hypothetical protein